METGWIQVFVLLLSECVAPEGKTVCQEQQTRMEFINKADCELALEQIIGYRDSAENVIVNREKSSCLPTAKKQQVYRTMEEARAALSEVEGYGEIPIAGEPLDFTQKAHLERLESTPACSDVGGVTPCKIGQIIVEGATEKKTDVWRRENNN